jgi:DNA (cytosine-5)-methyltransferase 1
VGGLSLGLSQAGFDMQLGVEIDSTAALNLKQNNKNMDVIASDIRTLDPVQLIKSRDLRKEDVNLIAGGPPCQGFSQSNLRTRSMANPANNLYKEYYRFIKYIKPDVFLFENVAGLKTLNNGELLRDILRIGSNLGYKIQWNIVNAEDFGVPQRRKRIILIGIRNATDRSFLAMRKGNIVTVRDAIDDLPRIDNGNDEDEMNYDRTLGLSDYQKKMRINSRNTVRNNMVTRNGELILERYKYIPQGGNWRNIPPHLLSNYRNTKNCHGWIYHRLKWDETSVVVGNFRKNMLIHPKSDRGLSVREAARLQSFPDNYIFYGRLDFQQQLVANAVPPFLAEQIGGDMINYLKEIK